MLHVSGCRSSFKACNESRSFTLNTVCSLARSIELKWAVSVSHDGGSWISRSLLQEIMFVRDRTETCWWVSVLDLNTLTQWNLNSGLSHANWSTYLIGRANFPKLMWLQAADNEVSEAERRAGPIQDPIQDPIRNQSMTHAAWHTVLFVALLLDKVDLCDPICVFLRVQTAWRPANPTEGGHRSEALTNRSTDTRLFICWKYFCSSNQNLQSN